MNRLIFLVFAVSLFTLSCASVKPGAMPDMKTNVNDIRDDDGDGVVNSKDLCPGEAEDYNEYKDYDGCSDEDTDGDGIPDHKDDCPGMSCTHGSCYNGCPDTDDDGVTDNNDPCPDVACDSKLYEYCESGCRADDEDRDGIPYWKDRCLEKPEDGRTHHSDGSQANPNDGCPARSDRDDDGLQDWQDGCPDDSEFNVFPLGKKDRDGCPDPDQDEDGIPDRYDQCPTVKEDDLWEDPPDGCPNTLKKRK